MNIHTYQRVRNATARLAEPLSAEDCGAQSMPDVSPTKWHLAHTSWFFETFVLAAADPNYQPFEQAYAYLFNSYYNGVGKQHPRPERGVLTRPSFDEVMAYRRAIDQRMAELLEAGCTSELSAIIELGLHHEQQHQELILTDIKHVLSRNALQPAYIATPPAAQRQTPFELVPFDGGVVAIGQQDGGFCFDNEQPRHELLLTPFALSSRLVSSAEYLDFMHDGGYSRPQLWLSEGWAWVQEHGVDAPLYWRRQQDGFMQHTLQGLRAVEPAEPVAHVSLFEADAFARWAGARLPREAELEHAARDAAIDGNFVETGALHPRAASATSHGVGQLYGDAWEWTQSSYAPYPGYRPADGAIGEYNGKFMCNQYVLRGGSCATPRSHMRPSYRNFFPASARWQFSGIRLAKDL